MLIPDMGEQGGTMPMALTVDPDDLEAAAKEFEAAANLGSDWLKQQSANLRFEPMGRDGVSAHLARSLGDNADGELGAIPTMTEAVRQLVGLAAQMRAEAAQYAATNREVGAAVDSVEGQA